MEGRKIVHPTHCHTRFLLVPVLISGKQCKAAIPGFIHIQPYTGSWFQKRGTYALGIGRGTKEHCLLVLLEVATEVAVGHERHDDRGP